MLDTHIKGESFEVFYQDERQCNQHSRMEIGSVTIRVSSQDPLLVGDLLSTRMHGVGRVGVRQIQMNILK